MISDWTKSLLLQEKLLRVNKLIIKGVFFSFLFCLAIPLFANNIRVEGKTKVTGFVGTDTAVIELNLQWDNSWRDDFNWDAAWIFFKYKKRGEQEIWHPAYLVREGHEAAPLSGNEGGNYTFMFGEAGSGSSAKVTGLYVIRDGISEGNVRAKLRVKLPLSLNGLTKSDFGEDYQGVYIAVHAIEMVYIPYGAYSLGDGYSGKSFVNSEKESLTIDSEDARSVYTLSSPSTPFSLSSSYPKGYAGFYVMKYEVSQEQYVEFLNSLTLSQQKSRVGNNDFERMDKGDYVFGDLKRPNCRNGIAFISQPRKEGAAVFGNNLNRENDFFSVDDGQTLACNYLSPSDMLAYCDWSGLRPMSELEYEKACRRPYPQVPEKGEYAWNTSSGVNSLQSESELSYRWSENEQAVSKQRNVNSGGHLNGPVRCGLFGNSQTSQSESGATYWGVMDMGGNLWEMCYNAESAGSKFVGNDFSYSHGDGVLDAGGNTDISASYWPFVVGAIGVRGGSFASSESMLRSSDRTYATGSYFTSFTTRDSSVGFRGARGVLNTTGFDGGAVLCPNGLSVDTVCAGIDVELQGVLPNNSIGKLSYVWYVSEDNGTSWQLLEDQMSEDLTYSFVNTTPEFKLYKFKRKVTCAVGEASTEAELYVAPLPWTADLDTYTNAYPNFTVTSTWESMPQTQWTLETPLSGISITSKGYVSGLTANSVFTTKVSVRADKCPGIEYDKRIVVCRDFSVVGTETIQLEPGKYVMECWGAQGGRGRTNWTLKNQGGYGAYTKGTLSLSHSQEFYVYVGGKGNDSGANGKCVGAAGGYNGGAAGGKDGNCDSQPEPGAGGGGASDIRLVGGTWNDEASLSSRIMVAAGGGGAVYNYTGGAGGTLSASGGASQTAGSAFGIGGAGVNNSKFTSGPGGGGSGYYGGKGGQTNGAPGNGGSSFISGHPGCNAINSIGEHTGQTVHHSGWQFYNTSMEAGVRAGNGYIRISPAIP